MGDLTKNISRNELACKCGCGFDTVDIELASVLQDVRDFYNAPLIITCGCRCEDHNRSVGGKANSKHLYGRAADFVVAGVTNQSVQAYLLEKYQGRFGIGCYGSFTHIDTRTKGPARW